jgi:hypothetical protein
MAANKERHFCFAYYGKRMHVPDFLRLHFSMVEGCCSEMGGRMVQFVRISLEQKNGRRKGTIPKIIDEYNNMEGRSETLLPVVLYPSLDESPIVCFKKTAGIQGNPILSRIEAAKEIPADGFWKWSPVHTPQEAAVIQLEESERHFVTISDIVRELQLPESTVSVKRVYTELSEPYFRKYNKPLGEGTGCIPAEQREFIVSEINRLFEDELSYIVRPPVSVLPPQAIALVDHAGWVGDIVRSESRKDEDPSVIRVQSVGNSAVRRAYVKTGMKGRALKGFLAHYALQWSNAGLNSVCYSIQELHRGWIDADVDFGALMGLIDGAPSCVAVQGALLRVPCVRTLLQLLCEEGLLKHVDHLPALRRMVVEGDCTAQANTLIVDYLERKIRKDWAGQSLVEVSAADVVRGLNGGEVGTYRQSCVRQFLKPFIADGSVEGFSWTEGSAQREKFVIHVAEVAAACRRNK